MSFPPSSRLCCLAIRVLPYPQPSHEFHWLSLWNSHTVDKLAYADERQVTSGQDQVVTNHHLGTQTLVSSRLLFSPLRPHHTSNIPTMRQSQSLLLLAFGSPAVAWTKFSRAEKSWSPPRETSPAENDAQFAQGWSPRPTDAPRALFGRMDLLPRADDYVLAPGTCGFVSSNEGESFLLQWQMAVARI